MRIDLLIAFLFFFIVYFFMKASRIAAISALSSKNNYKKPSLRYSIYILSLRQEYFRCIYKYLDLDIQAVQ